MQEHRGGIGRVAARIIALIGTIVVKGVAWWLVGMLLLTNTQLYSQSPNVREKGWGMSAYGGGLFGYRYDQPSFSTPYPVGGELYRYWRTNGRKQWHALYGYPTLCLSIAAFGFGQPDVLGNALAATGVARFRLANLGPYRLSLSLGTGLAFATKRHNLDTNPQNEAISTRVSFVARGGLVFYRPFGNGRSATANIGFRHYSNSSMELPNNGLNFVVFGLGMNIGKPSSPNKALLHSPSDTLFGNKIAISVLLARAWKEVLVSDRKRPVYALTTYAGHRISPYSSLLVGIDAFHYHPQIQENVASLNNTTIQATDEEWQVAITVGHELHFGKTSLVAQAGIYVYEPAGLYAGWYQRYSLKSFLYKHAFGQVSVKGYGGKSDIMEFGIGISF